MATAATNMNGCSIEQEYGEEVMCAGWNPQLSQLKESPFARTNKYAALPVDLASLDVDAFLKKMYEYQC
jgi:hypothetical protein